MLCFTAQILDCYKSCYFLVLGRPPFPSSCYFLNILLSWHERQCLRSLSFLLLTLSLYRQSGEHKSISVIISSRPLIEGRWDWIFLNITAVSQSWLRNFVSQIPLTCREFGCPVLIMALKTPPNICAMVSAHWGTFSLSWWADGHRQKHHCNWQQFIDSQGENLACCLASLVKTEIFSNTDQKKLFFFVTC